MIIKSFASKKRRRAVYIQSRGLHGPGISGHRLGVRGMQSEQALSSSGLQAMAALKQIRGKMGGAGRIAANINRTGVRQLQMAPQPRCPTMGTKLTTRMAGKAPKAYYGAKFIHRFYPLSTGCTLKGVEVSEVVSVVRDDFRSGVRNVPIGRFKWRLKANHEMDQPDHIYTQAGPQGIGRYRLRNWPAVIDQNQLWYYRHSISDPWKLGPGNTIKVTLSGKVNTPGSLRVKTTVNGKWRQEKYSGPKIRITPRRPRRRP